VFLSRRHFFFFRARAQSARTTEERMEKHRVSSVYVADGYPKILRYSAKREVKHYALTVDIGLSFEEADAKIGDGPLDPDEGWYRSDEPDEKTQLHLYMLVLYQTVEQNRVRMRYFPESTTARVLRNDKGSDHGYAIAASDVPSASLPPPPPARFGSSLLGLASSSDSDDKIPKRGAARPAPARVQFSKTSESEARDGWATHHLHAQDQRLHTVHLITGMNANDKLLELWYDLPAKRVLKVRTSDDPAISLTGLWVAPEHVPVSAEP